ncbi:MAG: sulfonate ABC transporter [Candidatus Korarchaeum sp.]|nr:sulfonate ABC transporter [Candidatus Korarchaeum sp.]MDW8036334.1 sulfonate ABC transporter [Candidatus Korarchaeum sp.]
MEVVCPVCGSSMRLPDDVIAGELLDCESCNTVLEVFEEGGSYALREAQGVLEDWGE